ncbi:hypothetical protein HGRIS_004009 [Hohenbuehelia grisea]|uniref:Uncharacterized protein n=1 Tax=Hohenbuehelia grisea TaxID=104357 RepID=A0ABR3JHD7_9AGAR
MGDARHSGCAVLLSNKGSPDNFVHNIRMNVGRENAGSIYRSYMTQHGQVEVDEAGWGVFTCFADCVQIWVKETAGAIDA